MKYLKYFENRAYGPNYISILDEDIEKYLPKKMGIYTMGGGGESGGSYQLELDTVTREVDILRVPYCHHLLDMDMFNHYIWHRAVDEKLLKLRLYFRFED